MMQSNSFVTNLYRGVSKRIKRLFGGEQDKKGLTWLKEKFLKHASPGPVRSFDYQNKKIYYSSPAEFLHTFKEIYINEIYKVPLPSNPFIIDCGANIGIGTLYLKEKYPSAEILAFEPDETNYSLLTRNVSSFGLKEVTARKEAVWIADTTLNFSGGGTMGGKIDTGGNSGNISVNAVRLKNFLNRKVDFLKIDIEGAEYAVLKDIAAELHYVSYLFLEYHGNFSQNNELTEIFNILQSAGLHYYIKEAAPVYQKPFMAKSEATKPAYDVQLNIFCFR